MHTNNYACILNSVFIPVSLPLYFENIRPVLHRWENRGIHRRWNNFTWRSSTGRQIYWSQSRTL